MRPRDARRAFRASAAIEGWLSCDAALLLALLDEVQRAVGVGGDAFEIGVHRGRSAAMIGALLAPGERLGLCDTFASGVAPDDVVAAVSAVTGLGAGQMTVHACESSALTSGEIGGRHRLVHVDGAHSAADVSGDLRLAAAALAPGGAIVLDDPFNGEWPGVAEGLFGFLGSGPGVSAVLAAHNKLVLVAEGDRESYLAALRDPTWLWRYCDARVHAAKEEAIAGAPAVVVYLPWYRWIPRTDVRLARLLWLRAAVRRRLSRGSPAGR